MTNLQQMERLFRAQPVTSGEARSVDIGEHSLAGPMTLAPVTIWRTVRHRRWLSRTLAPALLLVACAACGAHRSQPSSGARECGGGEQVFNDPVVAVARDSVTAGGPAAVAHFYWTAIAAPVSHGTWGIDDRTLVGTIDSLRNARVPVPQPGHYAFRARVLGSILRLDSLTIPPDSTVWLRIGLSRATLSHACVTASGAGNDRDRQDRL